ncbi:hypothetical protein ABGV36_00010 [Escherichia coli]
MHTERRFSVVIETATLSEMELADYCRRMGLFVEQVKEWRAISIQAHEMKMAESRRADKELREANTRLRELEKELRRKDKALAEAKGCSFDVKGKSSMPSGTTARKADSSSRAAEDY